MIYILWHISSFQEPTCRTVCSSVINVKASTDSLYCNPCTSVASICESLVVCFLLHLTWPSLFILHDFVFLYFLFLYFIVPLENCFAKILNMRLYTAHTTTQAESEFIAFYVTKSTFWTCRKTSWSFLCTWRNTTRWRSTPTPCLTFKSSESTNTRDSCSTVCTLSPIITVSMRLKSSAAHFFLKFPQFIELFKGFQIIFTHKHRPSVL